MIDEIQAAPELPSWIQGVVDLDGRMGLFVLTGQVLNMASLGSDTGVSAVTIKSWLSILRATYIIDFVEPFHVNLTTRLTKQPKLVFLDVGLMAYLLGIRGAAQVSAHPLRGALFETWGIVEVIKAWRNAGIDTRATYLRDKLGGKTDLVFENQEALAAFEFKSGATIAPDWMKSLETWQRRISGLRWSTPSCVYGGQESQVRSGVKFRAWRDFAGAPLVDA